jgi:hypothetical protein
VGGGVLLDALTDGNTTADDIGLGGDGLIEQLVNLGHDLGDVGGGQ